jgi:hypothetical protein
MKEITMKLSRRNALMTALFGAGAVGLRALATGLPVSFLLNPHRAFADYTPPTCFSKDKAQYLILNTSGLGDPLNGNVPGTYGDAGILHPADPTMAATPMTIGGKSYQAAAPWATLPPDVLARTSFFHHTTLTNAHPNQPKVMELMGAIQKQEMLVSLLSSHLAPCLGTVQPEPVTIGATGPSEALTFQGRALPILSPTGLKALLTQPAGPLANLQAMRDADLNRLNTLFKTDGTTAQKQFLDRYATSQTQVRSINQSLLGTLSSITKNDVPSQIAAAIALIQMNVTSVVAMHIPFGGDNHSDIDLVNETAQTVAGVASIVQLMAALKSAGLQDKVTFASMNVFGRTMAVAHKGSTGRDHLANHHCTLMIGKAIKGSVIGGVAPMAGDYGAMAINSTTGAGDANGDIKFEETLGAVGKTLGTALGVDPAVLNDQITLGKAVGPALA